MKIKIRLIDTLSQPAFCRKNYYEFEIDINDTWRGQIYMTRKEWRELKDILERNEAMLKEPLGVSVWRDNIRLCGHIFEDSVR